METHVCVYENAFRNGKSKCGQHYPMGGVPGWIKRIKWIEWQYSSLCFMATDVMSSAALSSHWHDFPATIDCTLKVWAINLSFLKFLFSGIFFHTKKKRSLFKGRDTNPSLLIQSHGSVCWPTGRVNGSRKGGHWVPEKSPRLPLSSWIMHQRYSVQKSFLGTNNTLSSRVTSKVSGI